MGKQREDCSRKIAAQQTRYKIVEAARKLIKEKGFDAIQITDITNEAGVAKGTFYTYFKKKEDVVEDIAYGKYQNIIDVSKKKNKDVLSHITYYLSNSMQYISDTGLKICQQWVKSGVDPENEDGVRKLNYDKKVIREYLNDAIDRNELSNDIPVNKVTDWIINEYYGIVFIWSLTNGEIDPIKELERFCKGILKEYLNNYSR